MMSEQPLRVLLVDDEASLREPLAKFLRENFLYMVDTAADGEQAWQRVIRSKGSYHVALIDDLLMPRARQEPEPLGIELMGKIKAHCPQTEVIIFTGWGMESERMLGALRAGAFRYLAKPFNLDELAILIRHAAEYQQLKGAAREKQVLERLMETSVVLLGGQSLQEVLNQILQRVRTIGFDRVRLYLLSDNGQSMIGKAHVGMDDRFMGVEWPVVDDFHMQVLLKDPRPHVFRRKDGRPVPFEDRLSKEGVDEWACVPLIIRGKIIGKLSADNKLSHLPIIEEELGPIALFASQAAAAIENAKLVEQLSEQKDHYARLVASSPNGIVAVDVQGNVTGFNERAQQILEYTADEVMHTPVARLYVDPQEPHTIGRELRRAADGRLANYETFARSKDGQAIPIRLSATWLYDAERMRIGSVGYFEDLRSIKETERRLELLLKASNLVAQAESLKEGLHSLAEMMVSLLMHTFCRILLLDESGQFLVVMAAYPIPRSGGQLNWEPGLEQRITISEWPGFRNLLDAGNLIVARWDDERARPSLVKFSRWLGLEKDIQSLLVIPLKIGNRMVGLLDMGEMRKEERSSFTPETIELAMAIAAQTTVLIDRMRLHDITERRRVELEHLHQAAQAMSGAFDLRQVLQTIVDRAKDMLRADSTAIWSYDSACDKFILEELVAAGIPDEELQLFREEEPRPGQTAYTVMQRGWVGVTDTSSQAFDFMGESTRELLKRIGVTSFQGIALKVGDEPVGVLYVNYRQPCTFGEEDRRPLENFATYAALSLKRARLLDQVRKAKRAAEVVARVTVLGDCEATLSSITQGTQEAVGCDAVVLYVYNQATNKLDHPPTMVEVHYPERATRFGEVESDSIVYTMLRQDKPYIVERIVDDPLFRDRRFAQDEEIKSCVAIPLKAAGQKVGVMFINYRMPHRFTKDELENIDLFTNQAAVAIHNAQLHDETRERAEALGALYEAGKAITSTLTLDEILKRITEQALRIIGASCQQEGCFSHVALLEGDKLRFIVASPSSMLEYLQRIPKIDLIKPSSQIGIAGRAAKTGVSQNVGDVHEDENYIPLMPHINSQLSVPLKIGEHVIGVMSIEHPQPSAFTAEDQEDVQLLAAQAVVAIQNAWQYDELKRTKGLVGARTALAWMGMASSTWRHTMEKHAITIREQIQLLRRELVQSPKSDSIGERLNMIERLANQILEKPMTPPLSVEEGVQSVPVNDLIRERTKRLWDDEPYKSVSLDLNLTLEDSATTRASPEWLRRALDVLVDNAVKATAGLPERKITLATRHVGSKAEVCVSDSGKGIPGEIHAQLLREPIKKPKGAKGLGMGLLFAQMIAQTYGGDVRCDSTGPAGTTMIISLPLEA